MLGKHYENQDCSLARALESVGERWTLLIVRDAFYGVRRFTDFQAHLDIPKAVLSDRLCGLVEDGILERRADPQCKGRQVYELTPMGRELWPTLHSLLWWSDRHLRCKSRTFQHAECGTELDARAACPTCQVTPDPGDIVTVPRRGRAPGRKDAVALALRSSRRLLQPIDASGTEALVPIA
jgi:DNA-binding HxlR family transcriptional regulator